MNNKIESRFQNYLKPWEDIENYFDTMKILSKETYDTQFNFFYEGWDWEDESIQRDIFVSVLDKIKTENPIMFELGCSGIDSSVYSLLFEKKLKSKGKIILTEPRKTLIDKAIDVYVKNGHLLNGIFYHGHNGHIKHDFGDLSLEVLNSPKLYIKDIILNNNITNIDVFHMDIQGSEVEVLTEIVNSGIKDEIKFFFISLHDTHQEIINIINKNFDNVKFYFNHPFKGGCGDGLIVFENINCKN
jgi:hypothetical protein